MGDTQQPQPARAGATSTEAAAELAEIQRRQEQVIKATLVPVWYWWPMAAAIIAIGVARDSGKPVVQAIVIPLAALVIVAMIIATIPAVRRVRANSAIHAPGPVAAAIIGMIVLVDTVIIGLAASLHAAHATHPGTIGSAAGAAVLIIIGPLLNGYMRRLMLRQARQQISDARQAGGSTP